MSPGVPENPGKVSFCEAGVPGQELLAIGWSWVVSSCVGVWGEMGVILLFALDEGGPWTAAHGGVRAAPSINRLSAETRKLLALTHRSALHHDQTR
jgi:hypothetical protein